jgi:hypothetical protein
MGLVGVGLFVLYSIILCRDSSQEEVLPGHASNAQAVLVNNQAPTTTRAFRRDGLLLQSEVVLLKVSKLSKI